jgi:tetratricopeptide (TPR) repeat protein
MSASAAQQEIQLGHAARKAGRTSEALDHYRSAIDREPGSAEAHSVYGLMLLQAGKAVEAEAPLRRAVELAPAHPAVRMNLAQWLAHEGRLAEAVQVVERIVADEPKHHWAWERLGELKARMRRFGEAAADFRRASELQPQDPSILFKLAQANFDNGRFAEARRALAAAAAFAPGNAAILRLDADLMEAAADWGGLERVAVAWRAIAPRDPAPWRALAKAQWQAGYPRRAMESLQQAFALGGRNAESLATYGRLCLHALDIDAASAALDQAERLDAGNAAVLSGQAVLHMWKGDHDRARAYCRRSLEANPADVTAYKALAQLSDMRLPEADAAALQALVASEGTRTADRVTGLFTLADGLDKEGRVEEAFASYERANRLNFEQSESEGLRYDRALRCRQTADLIRMFPSLPSIAAAAESGPTPIFIVGMPRSGTTLVESVLGAHPRVIAGGELAGIRWILPDFLEQARVGGIAGVPAAKWPEWRASYRKAWPEHGDALAVTDKNPWNFDAIGLIVALFPNARVIHVRRNPVETGFSIWRNEFSRLLRFTHRLEDIGHYYGEYARVIAHWERICGAAFRTIQYEDFVARFDEAARELVAYCGLEWDDACANFWTRERTVSTISTMQVRQPPKRASARSGAYAGHLGPLVESLRSMGVDLETGRFAGDS